MPAIDPDFSKEIRIVRVICIYFMLSVHIYPGLGNLNAAPNTPLYFIGGLWSGVMGRASVAALSLISGFLLAETLRQRDSYTEIMNRVRTLYLPMVVWNIVFTAVVLTAGAIGFQGNAWSKIEGMNIWQVVGQHILALNNDSLHQPLNFLRDVFATCIVLTLAAPLIRRFPLSAIIIALVLAVFDLTEPIVYRSAILFFATVGFAMTVRPVLLEWVYRLKYLFFIGTILLILLEWFPIASWNEQEQWVANIGNMSVRMILTGFILNLSRYLAKSKVDLFILRYEPNIFLVYLGHLTFFVLAWAVWQPVIGDAQSPYYPLFFLGLPLLWISLAPYLGWVVGQLPAAVQIALRGRAMATRN